MKKTSLSERAAARRLPRGRHQLTRKAVAAAQHARLLDAMAQAVAEMGYAQTSVADVVHRAGVSRRTFYEMFADKELCFLSAYESGLEFLLARVRQTVGKHHPADWRTRARLSIEAYLAALAAKPEAAWAYSIEALGAGRKTLRKRSEVMGRWVTQWRALQQLAQREDPAIAQTPDEELLALVGGIEELVRQCLLTRGAKHLLELTDTATAIAIATLSDGRGSARAAPRATTRSRRLTSNARRVMAR